MGEPTNKKGIIMQQIILTIQEAQRLKEWVRTLIYIQADDWDYINEILAAKINALHSSNWENWRKPLPAMTGDILPLTTQAIRQYRTTYHRIATYSFPRLSQELLYHNQLSPSLSMSFQTIIAGDILKPLRIITNR